MRGDLDLRVAPLSAAAAPAGPGWLVTNPPYGVRVGEADRLRDLYAQLGHLTRARLRGWTVAMVSPDDRLAAHTGLRFDALLRTRNGGLPVRFLRSTPAGDA